MTVVTETKSFIETQFPVSKLSKESFKERNASNSQTLTGLGKWWGRKPLVLVRATIIGLLMPASNDSRRDREIFLKILTMDEDGLWLRYLKKAESTRIPLKVVYSRLTPLERGQFFIDNVDSNRPRFKAGVAKLRDEIDRIVFTRMNYDERLVYCVRPEEIDGPPRSAWGEINEHLGTNARSVPELVEQLGFRRFGHKPQVGDAFCGGGSIPFEAARIGCDAVGTDLNPVSALLTWGALHIIGGGEEAIQAVRMAQQKVYEEVDDILRPLEENEAGNRAETYLYCLETRCPECGWVVPLLPTLIVGAQDNSICVLVPDSNAKRFQVDIKSNVSVAELEQARRSGTVRDSDLKCPNSTCNKSTPLTMIRGDRTVAGIKISGLRAWSPEDVVPHSDDTYLERLYCIRWTSSVSRENSKGIEVKNSIRSYAAPTRNDLVQEGKVFEDLSVNIDVLRAGGHIPTSAIEAGEKTSEPIRTRGWTHWSHLFNPRQLFQIGTIFRVIENFDAVSTEVRAGLLLGAMRCPDYNSRLSRWCLRSIGDLSKSVFSNQALNTLYNYPARSLPTLSPSYFLDVKACQIAGKSKVYPCDARVVNEFCDLWITDPPYADAINYHELTEFFLAWIDSPLRRLFPDWYTDSKRALAVRGSTEDFRQGMVDCYKNLTRHMPENGMQVVMFTHQDAGVWADLALILWAAGLRVTGAWCIATETGPAVGEGNYVQGTVLLILQKQTGTAEAFLDELYPLVDEEVKSQLASMLELDDEEDPNFGDTDYQLAAYAAALRVLTSYSGIEDIDITYELSKVRATGEQSPIEAIIDEAVKTACDYLVPKGMDDFTWKTLSAEERFYLKGLDLESHGEYRTGAYQELARGFGLREYKDFLGNAKANETRLKTPTEFGRRMLGGASFGGSLVRHALFAIRETIASGDAQSGKNWLRNEVSNYWNERQRLLAILRYLARFEHTIDAWQIDAAASVVVAGAVENDHT